VAAVNFQSSIATLDRISPALVLRASLGSLYNAEARAIHRVRSFCRSRRRGAATPFAIVAAARRPQFPRITRLRSCSRRRGPAHLYRSHQTSAATPHPRLRDSPRVDHSEATPINRARSTRAERRLKNLDVFKSVKMSTEPAPLGSRHLIVALEEKSPATFVIGRLSTQRRRARQVSISEATYLGGPVREGSGDLRPSTRAHGCRSSSLICSIIASPSASDLSIVQSACQRYISSAPRPRLQPAARLRLRETSRCSCALDLPAEITLPSPAANVT